MSTQKMQPIPRISLPSPPEALLETCVHCGMCLASCPTYRESGLEVASPRGRITLMRAVAQGRTGLDSQVFQQQMSECLGCRACEAECPSGVPYGFLLHTQRLLLEAARHPPHALLPPHPWWLRMVRRAVFDGVFAHMSIVRLLSALLAVLQHCGTPWLFYRSGGVKGFAGNGIWHGEHLFHMMQMLPKLGGWASYTRAHGQRYEAKPPRRLRVALHIGCVMSTVFPHVHAATIRVLQRQGCEVWIPAGQTCCGALHGHSGEREGMLRLARRNIVAFAQHRNHFDAIISNAAGCGSMLKEYGEWLSPDPLWREWAHIFSAAVQDIHEFLARIELNRDDLQPLSLTVTYSDPCHLAHAQRITQQPRMLLETIPGLMLREMEEASHCCGSAGIYNLTHPQMAWRLGQRKIRHIRETGAEVVVTANPGCAIQLAGALKRTGHSIPVRFLIELLDEAYRD